MIVFVAGQTFNGDREVNLRKAFELSVGLMMNGLTVYLPQLSTVLLAQDTRLLPVLTQHNLAWLAKAHVILRVDDSPDAKAYLSLASPNIPVFTDPVGVVMWETQRNGGSVTKETKDG